MTLPRLARFPRVGFVLLAVGLGVTTSPRGVAQTRVETAGSVAATASVAPPAAPGAPLDLPFEQLPDYWLAQPTTVSLSATPLPCQAGSLNARYTIGANGAVADPAVVASTLDAPHQSEALAWVTQARYEAAPANAARKPVRVSQQILFSCG